MAGGHHELVTTLPIGDLMDLQPGTGITEKYIGAHQHAAGGIDNGAFDGHLAALSPKWSQG